MEATIVLLICTMIPLFMYILFLRSDRDIYWQTMTHLNDWLEQYDNRLRNTLKRSYAAIDTSERVSKYIEKKIEEIGEITDKQAKLLNNVHKPSTGAAHSRWKNDAIAQLKELEANKINIMETILDISGDFKLQVVNQDGDTSSKLLSEIIQQYKENSTGDKPPTIPETPKRHLKIIKN